MVMQPFSFSRPDFVSDESLCPPELNEEFTAMTERFADAIEEMAGLLGYRQRHSQDVTLLEPGDGARRLHVTELQTPDSASYRGMDVPLMKFTITRTIVPNSKGPNTKEQNDTPGRIVLADIEVIVQEAESTQSTKISATKQNIVWGGKIYSALGSEGDIWRNYVIDTVINTRRRFTQHLNKVVNGGDAVLDGMSELIH